MATFTSVKEFRKVQEKRIKALVKAGDRSSMAAAKFQVLQGKRLAPRGTGETIQGIKKRKLKSGKWIAESIVTGKGKTKFRQNMWANRTPPHDKPRMRWNKKRPTLYGFNHNTTGLPRWWDVAAAKTRRQFGKGFRRETINALRIST